MHMLAALTPGKHDVRIIEEEFTDIPLDLEADLVGISLMTANAPRGYALAEHFRKKGAKIVLGGIHVSVLPEEGLQHADAVVIGEGEGVWPEIVSDAEAGTLREIYKSEEPVDLSHLPFPRRDLAPVKRFLNMHPVMTTRGCPYACEFCSASRVYGRLIRNFPVSWVVDDIKRTGGRFFLILDDNVIGRPDYALELFEALKPLDITWVGQASMSFANREDLMRKAHESGCRALFFGLETVSERSMKRMKKSFRDRRDVAEGIRNIQDHGIAFFASVVFGFDTDGPEIFDETLTFLKESRVFATTFNILTPYPGTEVFDRFKREERLFSEDWYHYDHTTVVYKPKLMDPRQLAEGHLRTRRAFYSWSSVLKRFHVRNPLVYSVMNYAFRSSARSARLPLAPGSDGPTAAGSRVDSQKASCIPDVI